MFHVTSWLPTRVPFAFLQMTNIFIFYHIYSYSFSILYCSFSFHLLQFFPLLFVVFFSSLTYLPRLTLFSFDVLFIHFRLGLLIFMFLKLFFYEHRIVYSTTYYQINSIEDPIQTFLFIVRYLTATILDYLSNLAKWYSLLGKMASICKPLCFHMSNTRILIRCSVFFIFEPVNHCNAL